MPGRSVRHATLDGQCRGHGESHVSLHTHTAVDRRVRVEQRERRSRGAGGIAAQLRGGVSDRISPGPDQPAAHRDVMRQERRWRLAALCENLRRREGPHHDGGSPQPETQAAHFGTTCTSTAPDRSTGGGHRPCAAHTPRESPRPRLPTGSSPRPHRPAARPGRCAVPASSPAITKSPFALSEKPPTSRPVSGLNATTCAP